MNTFNIGTFYLLTQNQGNGGTNYYLQRMCETKKKRGTIRWQYLRQLLMYLVENSFRNFSMFWFKITRDVCKISDFQTVQPFSAYNHTCRCILKKD